MVSQTSNTTADAQHQTTTTTVRKPSAALDAFMAEVERDAGVIDGLTRRRVCENLAYAMPEPDIRITNFNIKFNEPSETSPVGSLIIQNSDIPAETQIGIHSTHMATEDDGTLVGKTTFNVTVYRPHHGEITTVAEDIGCVAALKAASMHMDTVRDDYTGRLTQLWRALKHDINHLFE